VDPAAGGVIAGEGAVGIADLRGQLVTFSLPDLAPAATIEFDARDVVARPTQLGDLTVLVTDRNELVAFDRALAVAWRVPLVRGAPSGELATSEGNLVVACRGGWLCLHDGKTGQETAATDLGEPLVGTPLVVGDHALVPTAAGALLKVALPRPKEAAP
jgi:hypothetical protein